MCWEKKHVCLTYFKISPPKLVLFLWRWKNYNNYQQTFSEDHLYFWSCLQVSFGAGLCLPPYCCSFSVAGLVPFSEYCAWSVIGVVQLLGCGNWSATHSTFWSSFRNGCMTSSLSSAEICLGWLCWACEMKIRKQC